MRKYKIYQAFYDNNSKGGLDGVFIPYDNTGKHTKYYENQIFLDLYRSGKHTGCDLFGLLSWQFRAKTAIVGSDLLAYLDAEQSLLSCYNLIPEIYTGQAYYDLFNTEELKIICRMIDKDGVLPVRLEGFDFGRVINYCNYWLMTPELFASYMETFMIPAMDWMEKNDDVMKTMLIHYRGQIITYHTFFLERLVSVFMKHYNINFKYILSSDIRNFKAFNIEASDILKQSLEKFIYMLDQTSFVSESCPTTTKYKLCVTVKGNPFIYERDIDKPFSLVRKETFEDLFKVLVETYMK